MGKKLNKAHEKRRVDDSLKALKTIYDASKCADDETVGGFIYIAAPRTIEQVMDDNSCNSVQSGIATNIKDDSVFGASLVTAVKDYFEKDKATEKETMDKVVELLGQMFMSVLLSGKHNIANSLSWLIDNVIAQCNDKGVVFALLPNTFVDTDSDDGEMDTAPCGMLSTYKKEDQVHAFACMILAYCAKNKIDVENFAGDIHRAVMMNRVELGDDDAV